MPFLMIQIYHEFDPRKELIEEAGRVYQALDALIPDSLGVQRNWSLQSKPSRVLSDLLGIAPSLVDFDRMTGSIGTLRLNSQRQLTDNYLLKISYDTHQRGHLTIETTILPGDDILNVIN